MAYQNGKTYYIVPTGNTGLALNLQGTGAITNNRNVNIYTKDNSTDQQWVLRTYSGFARLLCKANHDPIFSIHLKKSLLYSCLRKA